MKAFFTLLGVVMFASNLAAAGDAALGRAKATKCKQCHGLDGIGMMPNIPNIAGQKDAYLVAQLRAYRGGKREDQMMSFIAKDLSDEDIDNLAAYFSSIKIEVTVPQ